METRNQNILVSFLSTPMLIGMSYNVRNLFDKFIASPTAPLRPKLTLRSPSIGILMDPTRELRK